MRESLTIFAIALIILLSALLVGPYLVDWNGQRDWLAAKLSHAVGAEVHIAGPIDVKLLPRPIFRASDVSILGRAAREPRFSAQRLDAELSLNGLLQGTIEFVDARLTAPRLEVTLRHDGSVVAPAVSAGNAERIQFSHIDIDRGSLVVLNESGQQTAALAGIDAQGQADTLFGPLKLDGTAETDAGAVTFRLSTGAYQSGRLRVHAAVDRKGVWDHADVDGMLSIAAPGTRPGLSFEGRLGMSGEIGIAAATAPVPWHLSATGTTADLQGIAMPAIEVRAGADSRALVVNGTALISLGDKPAAIAQLRARQLDLDHITVPPEVAPDTPKPRARQWLAALGAALDGSKTLPLRLKTQVAVDAVTSGDLTLTDLTGSIDAAPGASPAITLAINGPNASRAAFDGTIGLGAVPVFKGTADVTTRDLGTAVGWIEPFTAGLPTGWQTALQDESGAFRGHVDLSSTGLVARDTTLDWGGTTLAGTLTVTAGTNGQHPRVFADLTARSLDPAAWPSLHQGLALVAPLDVDLSLRSDSVSLARADNGAADTARLAVHGVKKGSDITVDKLSISGFGGASLEATGSLGSNETLDAQGQATVHDLSRIAGSLKAIAPALPWDRIGDHGAGLAPLIVSFQARAHVGDDGTVTPTSLTLNGAAAATRFALSFTPKLQGGGDTQAEATMKVDAPEAGQVLQQFGWSGGRSLGALHVEAQGQGSLADGWNGKVSATLPTAAVSFAGRLSEATGQGRFALDSSDLGALLSANLSGTAAATVGGDLGWHDGAIGLHNIAGRIAGSAVTGDLDRSASAAPDTAATPVVTGRLSLDAASLPGLLAVGSGSPQPKAGTPAAIWSSLPFSPVPSWPSADVALHVGSLALWPGIAGRDSDFSLQVRSGTITVANLVTHLLDGVGGGTVTIRRTGVGASVVGQAHLDKVKVALPSLSGRLSGQLHLAGSGQSPAAIIGSLAGDGTLALAGATLPNLAADAPLRAAAQFNGEGLDIEQGPVNEAVTKALAKSPVVLGDISVSATIAAGDIRVTNAKANLPDATVTTDAALDLSALTLDLRSTLATSTAPPDWKGDPPQVTVTWKGPLLAPSRVVDAATFANGLAARAIGREQERIELMKDDLRERAFFARRLKQIEAEQQAAREAAAASKSVPHPPPRPTDIRLPKPPDVGPPTVPMSLKPQPAPQDGITQLLKALPDDTKPAARGRQGAGAAPVGRPEPKTPDPVPAQSLY